MNDECRMSNDEWSSMRRPEDEWLDEKAWGDGVMGRWMVGIWESRSGGLCGAWIRLRQYSCTRRFAVGFKLPSNTPPAAFIVNYNGPAEGICGKTAVTSMKILPPKEMMPTTSRIGAVERRHREAQGLSLEVVAKRAGITPVALHNLETGKASGRSDTYERVGKAIGIPYVMVVVEAALESPVPLHVL